MNDIIQAMKDRRSIRKYQDKPVPRELIEQVIEAGLWAPSGQGQQPVIIVAVTNKELRDQLAAANAAVMGGSGDPFYGAPVVLVVLADRSRGTRVCDGSLALGNMMLAASSLGLGSCWIHRAQEVCDEPAFKELLAKLGVEGDYEGVGNCILGWPAEEPAPKPRREGRVFWAE